jgi:WD40 repeat protein
MAQNCPVCKKECPRKESYCQQCGWELKSDLILGLQTKESAKNYEDRLQISQRKWKELENLRKGRPLQETNQIKRNRQGGNSQQNIQKKGTLKLLHLAKTIVLTISSLVVIYGAYWLLFSRKSQEEVVEETYTSEVVIGDDNFVQISRENIDNLDLISKFRLPLGEIYEVKWSPSGKKMAFRDSLDDLFVYDIEHDSYDLLEFANIVQFEWVSDSSTLLIRTRTYAVIEGDSDSASLILVNTNKENQVEKFYDAKDVFLGPFVLSPLKDRLVIIDGAHIRKINFGNQSDSLISTSQLRQDIQSILAWQQDANSILVTDTQGQLYLVNIDSKTIQIANARISENVWPKSLSDGENKLIVFDRIPKIHSLQFFNVDQSDDIQLEDPIKIQRGYADLGGWLSSEWGFYFYEVGGRHLFTANSSDGEIDRSFEFDERLIDITISPDKARFASATERDISIWDFSSGAKLFALEKNWPKGDILDMDWCPCGNLLAVSYSSGIVDIWDTDTGQKVSSTIGHSSTGDNTEFNLLPEKTNAITLFSNNLNVVDFLSNKIVEHYPFSTEFRFRSCKLVSTDLKAFGYLDGSPISVDFRDPNNSFSLHNEDLVSEELEYDGSRLSSSTLALSPNEENILLWEDDLFLISAIDGNRKKKWKKEYSFVTWGNDDIILALSQNDDELTVLSAQKKKILFEISPDLETGFPFSKALLSSNGQYVAVSGNSRYLWVVDVESQETVMLSNSHAEPILDIEWSPTASIIASASQDFTIRLTDMNDLDQQNILLGHTNEINELIWSPSGDLLLSRSLDGSIRIWDVEKAEQVYQWDSLGSTHHIEWSRDGFWLIMGGNYETLYVYGIAAEEGAIDHDGSE